MYEPTSILHQPSPTFLISSKDISSSLDLAWKKKSWQFHYKSITTLKQDCMVKLII